MYTHGVMQFNGHVWSQDTRHLPLGVVSGGANDLDATHICVVYQCTLDLCRVTCKHSETYRVLAVNSRFGITCGNDRYDPKQYERRMSAKR